MSAPTYLYGSSTAKARHLAVEVFPGAAHGRAFCGGGFDTEAEMEFKLRRWNTTPEAEKWIARRRSLPVCKSCERAVRAGEEPNGD